MGKETDIMIIGQKDGECCAIAHGNPDEIAKALFYCMHDPNSAIGDVLYRILKLNTQNLLKNPTNRSVDFVEMIIGNWPEWLEEKADESNE